MTVQSVLNEVRDAKAREYLSTLPFTLEILVPSDESVNFVRRFGQESGDVSFLSETDIMVSSSENKSDIFRSYINRLLR